MKSAEEVEASYAKDQAAKDDGVAAGANKGWVDVLASMASDEQDGQGLEQPGDAAGVAAKDWYDVLATMNLDDGADVASGGGVEEEANKDEGWADFLSRLQQSDGQEKGSWGLVPTVDTLDVNRFTGRWFQVREGGRRGCSRARESR